ncbi:hypothetical protein [Nostoc sp.]|uniref:hypothetical protein n=1 Tax=Nostoc sp. TaxID=1180 RepID=UPI002FFD3DB2
MKAGLINKLSLFQTAIARLFAVIVQSASSDRVRRVLLRAIAPPYRQYAWLCEKL